MNHQNNKTNNEEVDQLERIIRELSIESERSSRKQQRIQEELRELRIKLQHQKQHKNDQHVGKTETIKGNTKIEGYNAIGDERIRDRNGDILYVGARVYICTRGAYSSKRGVVETIARAPKLCTIIDLDGITQSRLSKNLVIENKHTLKYLK